MFQPCLPRILPSSSPPPLLFTFLTERLCFLICASQTVLPKPVSHLIKKLCKETFQAPLPLKLELLSIPICLFLKVLCLPPLPYKTTTMKHISWLSWVPNSQVPNPEGADLCVSPRSLLIWCCVWTDAGPHQPRTPTVTSSTPSSRTGWLYVYHTHC